MQLTDSFTMQLENMAADGTQHALHLINCMRRLVERHRQSGVGNRPEELAKSGDYLMVHAFVDRDPDDLRGRLLDYFKLRRATSTRKLLSRVPIWSQKKASHLFPVLRTMPCAKSVEAWIEISPPAAIVAR